MKRHLLIFLLLLTAAAAHAQTRADYDATAARLKNYYNNMQVDSIYYMMTSRMQSLVPLDKMEPGFKQLYTQLGNIRSYTFSKQKDGIYFYKTVFTSSVLSMVIALDSDNKMSTFRFIPYQPDSTQKKDKSNIVLKTATGNIYGMLLLPQKTGKVPVVLIIAGSGPTDRDGNDNMGLSTDAYKMIADSLQKAGVASVRYDKRSVGESAAACASESDLRFDDEVKDAGGFIKMLKEDMRFSSVIVLGHSEGSLIGMIAAAREKAAGYISVSGIAERADKVIEKQIASSAPALLAAATTILDSLDRGYKVTDVNEDLQVLFHSSVQPYMISWLKYDPSREIKKLKIPVLILQGTTDMQVSVDQAENLKKDYPHATLQIIDGMSHVLKQAPADKEKNGATYADPTLPLSPGLMPAIIKFILYDIK
jgi:pimeloyl-ACP methyl ester carboxylesterase